METPYYLIDNWQHVERMTKQIYKDMRIARLNHWISQSELAEGASMPRSVITRFEIGNTNPTLKTLLTIAAALGVELVVRDPVD